MLVTRYLHLLRKTFRMLNVGWGEVAWLAFTGFLYAALEGVGVGICWCPFYGMWNKAQWC